MPAEAIFSELTFEQVIAQIFARQCISCLDRELLARALPPEIPLTREQYTAISTIFEALQSGRFKAVD